MQNKACIAELGAHYWYDIEGNVDKSNVILILDVIAQRRNIFQLSIVWRK